MTCQSHKDLMMGYVDNELDDDQRKSFEEHLSSCPECTKELEGFKHLKQITDEVTLVEPEDRVWEQYWSGIYNRIERRLGWMLFSIGSIALIIYVGFKMIEETIADPTVGVILKIALLAFIAGFAILFVSVLRERLCLRKKDRYKDIVR